MPYSEDPELHDKHAVEAPAYFLGEISADPDRLEAFGRPMPGELAAGSACSGSLASLIRASHGCGALASPMPDRKMPDLVNTPATGRGRGGSGPPTRLTRNESPKPGRNCPYQ